ncbi:MAG: ABC transporter ATP-binding protein [Campylobacterota bacterium]|nr:ABC transporter ATP-binding protein [Campylobacterota bacterium]
MIKIETLTCKYDEEPILENLSLHVKRHLSILGANGAGKSTLAKALCNLIDFEGTIVLDAHDIRSLSPQKLAQTIIYIPTKLEVYDPYISVFDFVLLGRFPYKKSLFEYSKDDKKRVSSNLELLNLEHLKEHTLSSLSSGEQQLVLIAQALTQESKIIIFDEPTANLDPSNAKIIAKHIKLLKESHHVILITHDLHLACYIDNPVLFISKATTEYFETREHFFDADTLERLYGVSFHDLAVVYE